MNELPLLSIILLAPLTGALILFFVKEDLTVRYVSAIAAGITLLLSVFIYASYDRVAGGMQFVEHIPWIERFGVAYALGVDGISLPLVLLTAIVTFTGIFASWTGIRTRVKEFHIALLILVTGVFGVFLSSDLFFFFIFYEIAVIPMYLLIAVWGSTRKEYGAMKLTIYLMLGSAFLVIGMVMMYLQSGTGTFSIAALAGADYPVEFQKLVFLLFLIGFGVLAAIWPLHTWSPDGHVAAPTAVSMLHAGVLMKLAAYGLLRVGIFAFPVGAQFWAPLIATLATVNAIYGAMVAMAQRDMKFVVGYSSVSHMGYVLFGLAAATAISINGAVLQMFAHGVMTALFFALVGLVYDKAHTRYMPDLGGLAHQMPRVAAAFVIACLASLGLPGLVNFVAEFLIFSGSIRVFPVQAVLSILAIVITAAYVLRVAKWVFFGPRNKKWDHLPDAQGIEMVPIVMLVAVLVFFGVFPDLLTGMIDSSVTALLNGSGIVALGGGF
ncbi:MAG TPA: NADH-quinone oxidoreductase subunit M [Firmicutes bacterium]|jgi:NADH-quinone oxidoreductase subunit M|nr:NADH-quinone oxidoreductase subunit M [Bacillota bacterium]